MTSGRSPLLALAFVAVAIIYGILFLGAERERAVGALLVGAAAAETECRR